MDWDTWQKLYRRLCASYGKAVNGEQAATFFEALSGFTAGVVEAAVTAQIKASKTFPKAAELCEHCRAYVRAHPVTRECDSCLGSGWVDAPDQAHHGLTYTGYVRRCPTCYPGQAA